MKVISFGLDNKIFDPLSEVARRAVLFGNKVDKYLVVVPTINQDVNLSNQVTAWGVSGINKIHSFFNIYKRVSSLLKKEKFYLLTVQDTAYLGFLGLILAKKFHLKFEVQVHGFEKNNILRDYLAKQCLANADLVRVVSARLRQQIKEKYHLFVGKIYIAPVALDKNKLINTGILDLHKIYPDHFIFLTVGRLVSVKNIALQLSVIKKLNNREKIKLIIVGEGLEKDRLKKLANDLNIREQVIFYDWQEKIGDLYHSADCLLLTSNSEGYGLVVAEAILSDLPVIMTEVGVAGDLVEDGVNGFIVPVGDQLRLVEKISEVIQDKNLLPKFKQNCSNYKRKILDKDQLIQVVLDHWRLL